MDNNIGDVRLFRMITGEDVVALYSNFSDKDDTVTLLEPMLVKKIKVEGKWMTTLVPWLPIDIININVATVSIYNIMIIMEPTEFFIEEYKMSVDHFLAMVVEDQTIEELYSKVLEAFEFPEIQH